MNATIARELSFFAKLKIGALTAHGRSFLILSIFLLPAAAILYWGYFSVACGAFESVGAPALGILPLYAVVALVEARAGARREHATDRRRACAGMSVVESFVSGCIEAATGGAGTLFGFTLLSWPLLPALDASPFWLFAIVGFFAATFVAARVAAIARMLLSRHRTAITLWSFAYCVMSFLPIAFQRGYTVVFVAELSIAATGLAAAFFLASRIGKTPQTRMARALLENKPRARAGRHSMADKLPVPLVIVIKSFARDAENALAFLLSLSISVYALCILLTGGSTPEAVASKTGGAYLFSLAALAIVSSSAASLWPNASLGVFYRMQPTTFASMLGSLGLAIALLYVIPTLPCAVALFAYKPVAALCLALDGALVPVCVFLLSFRVRDFGLVARLALMASVMGLGILQGSVPWIGIPCLLIAFFASLRAARDSYLHDEVTN